VSRVSPLLLTAALVAGCASTREDSSAAIQADLPRLVAACNGAFRDGSRKGSETVTVRIAVITEGLEACDRLALAGGIDQVRPATAEIYQRYRAAMTTCAANTAHISALGGTNRAALSCPEQATVAVTQWVAANHLGRTSDHSSE
jgi:hypothetical protein